MVATAPAPAVPGSAGPVPAALVAAEQDPAVQVRSRIRAWPASQPVRSIMLVTAPAANPSTMVPPKNSSANGQPNSPALRNSSSGLVSGEATMKATIGAHGARVAIIPSTIAVVPHEQNGVSAASSTAPVIATQRRRESQAPSRSVPAYTGTAAAATIDTSRYGQSAASVPTTSLMTRPSRSAIQVTALTPSDRACHLAGRDKTSRSASRAAGTTVYQMFLPSRCVVTSPAAFSTLR